MNHAPVSSDVTLAWDSFGDPGHPPLFLVMGLGAQMIAWRDAFCEMLAGHGLYVVRFDNRDSGLSTHFSGTPDMQALFSGDTSSAPYTLDDMAQDTIALIGELGYDSVHLAGASMGGMIAQTVAATAPERVRSLISIMSTTGEREVSQPTPEAQAVLVGPRSTTVEEVMRRSVESARVIGSPGLVDEDAVRELARESFERSFDPESFARQLAAIWKSGDRTDAVRTISAPTLVMHGEVDPLIPVAAGRATAAAIDGSELLVIEGMGHDLPRPLWPRITGAMAEHALRNEP
jgi:pimeloyl-ACP methyl ester carboxylesterase